MVRLLLLTFPLSLVSTIKAIPLDTTRPSHKGAMVEAATTSRAALATPPLRATHTKIMTAQVDVQVRACSRDQQSHAFMSSNLTSIPTTPSSAHTFACFNPLTFRHCPLTLLPPSLSPSVFPHPYHPPSSPIPVTLRPLPSLSPSVLPIPITHLPLPFPSTLLVTLLPPHPRHPSLSSLPIPVTHLPPTPSDSAISLPHPTHPPPSPIPLTHLPPPFPLTLTPSPTGQQQVSTGGYQQDSAMYSQGSVARGFPSGTDQYGGHSGATYGTGYGGGSDMSSTGNSYQYSQGSNGEKQSSGFPGGPRGGQQAHPGAQYGTGFSGGRWNLLFMCAGGVCCPLSFVPSVHTHMHTYHLPSLVCIGSRFDIIRRYISKL